VIAGILSPGETQLAQVIEALGALSLAFRLAHRRQQHPRQDRDDGDDDEQFNESEGVSGTPARFWTAATG
jgi:hypothetical protein